MSGVRTGTAVLYHVTPAENTRSILEGGISPDYHTGRLAASWYVRKQDINWSIIHVSNSHYESVANLAVCAVLVDWEKMKRTNRPGFYYTFETYTPESVTPAILFVDRDFMGLGEELE
jgi:hypothetical protein